MLKPDAARAFCEQTWEAEILPVIHDYILIPNKSPAYDADWKAHGHMDRAVALLEGWCRAQQIPGLTVEVVRLLNDQGQERTPVLFMEIPGTGGAAGDTVLLYGHLDKQPEMTGWREGLSPWSPVREGDRLYGRGGADDGYATFASLAALRLLHEQGLPHARCVVLIEADEESGSTDLPAYIDHLAARIGQPSLVVCLDSGCANYDQLWMTTSLRGLVGGNLTVKILREGVHSGDASGIVPSSFRILRMLLDRVEDPETGEIQMRCPALMQGYYKNPEQTAQTMTADGWLRTGDKGSCDAQGRLSITGRVKDIFKTSKGKYVAPAPIEDLLVTHSDIEACAVTGANLAQPLAVVMLSQDAAQRCADPQAKQALLQSLEQHLQSVNNRLDYHERLECLAVVSTLWTPENGFVTPTFKVKRDRIEAAYGAHFEPWAQSGQRVVWADAS